MPLLHGILDRQNSKHNDMRPNYKKIYQDILREQFPEKLKDPKVIKQLNNLDTAEAVLKLNEMLFEHSEKKHDIKGLKFYDEKTVLKLLKYQDKHGFSNKYMSQKYKISRSTIIRWRKLFI